MTQPGRLSRRTIVTTGAGAVFAAALPPGAYAAAPAPRGRKRAFVLVVDGCRPDEITPTLTPTLAALRAGGLDYPRAAGLPVLETLPNHAMMMTGMRPDRTGVPANVIHDRQLGEIRTLDRPGDLRARTVIQRLNHRGFTTATVLSKEYLVGLFGRRASYRWVPPGYLPESDHAPDLLTMDATLSMVEEHDPNLVFVNLGDIDRTGHSDPTGPLDARAFRRLALADTDAQVSRLVDLLRSSGRWANSLVMVLADHSMDWSLPDAGIALGPALEADPFLAGRVAVAENGGADLLYWLGPARQRDRAVARMRAVAGSVDGVLRAVPRTRPSLRLGPEAGDVVAYCERGRRFSEEPASNPVPGNHGHPVTRPIPFFLAGGHPSVPRGTRRARARTTDVAPTLSRFFGIGAPRSGYDGSNRLPR